MAEGPSLDSSTGKFIFPVLALLAVTACNNQVKYPPGGYPYPQHVAAKDTNFYYYPIKDKETRRDSFNDAVETILYQAYNEPNLSIRPLPVSVFRFIYSMYHKPYVIILLTPKEITVKKESVPYEFNYMTDTDRLDPTERNHLSILKRFYPIDEGNYSAPRRHFLDSIGNRYPQLRDPVYYWYLQKKDIILNSIPIKYTTTKIPISPEEYRRLVSAINASGYWRLPSRHTYPPGGTEGSYSLEANTPQQYHYVHDPYDLNDSGKYALACQELVNSAKMGKEIRLVSDHTIDTVKPAMIIQDVQLEEVKEPKKPKHKKK